MKRILLGFGAITLFSVGALGLSYLDDTSQLDVVNNIQNSAITPQPLLQASIESETPVASPLISVQPQGMTENEINKRLSGLLLHVKWLVSEKRSESSSQNRGGGSSDKQVDRLERQLFSYMDDSDDNRSELSEDITEEGSFLMPTLTSSTLTGTTTAGSLTATGLGVGTTSPSDVLAVDGAVYLAETTPLSAASRLYNTAGDLYWNGSLIAGGAVGNWNASGGDVYRLTGNVGIGTSSPSVPFHVVGGGAPDGNPAAIIQNDVSGGWARTLTLLTPNVPDGTASGMLTFGQSDSIREAGHMYFVDSAVDGEEYIGFAINNAPGHIMTLTGSATVGIGTTLPTSKLTVEHTGSGDVFRVNDEASDTTPFVINEDGFVGIGMSNPSEIIEIHGDTDADLDMFSYGTDSTSFHIGRAAGTKDSPGLITGNNALFAIEAMGYDGAAFQKAAAINFRGSSADSGLNDMPGWIRFLTTPDGSTSLVERMVISENGNVGIGSTSPSSKLTVYGDINISDASQGYEIGGNRILYASSTNFATAVGIGAGQALLSDGLSNTALGYQALYVATSSNNNTAIGHRSLFLNNTGYSNTAQGAYSLNSNTTGYNNTAQGADSLIDNISGYDNSAQGRNALSSNTTGYSNSAQGAYSLNSNTTGYRNTAQGGVALYSNTTGYENSAQGRSALFSNTTGRQNIALGANAGYDINTATSTGANTVIGYDTGRGIVTGVNNTILGANVTGLSSTLSNNIILADGAGNQRINVDSSGNVGIGTNAPTSKLVVSREGAIPDVSGMGDDPELHLLGEDGKRTRLLIDNVSDSLYPALTFRSARGTSGSLSATQNNDVIGLVTVQGYGTTDYGPATKAAVVIGAGANWTDASQPTYLNFHTVDVSNTSPVERMRINYDGNVGIGAAAPSSKLTVSGDIDISDTTQSYKIGGETVLYASDTGFSTLVGIGAGENLISSGSRNVAIGYQALNTATSSVRNIAVGYKSLFSINGTSPWADNVSIGHSSQKNSTSGHWNVSLGSDTMEALTTGFGNVALGSSAIRRLVTGDNNTAIGRDALFDGTSGSGNVAVGRDALFRINGDNNIAIGHGVANNVTSGSNNIFIGYDIETASTTANNQLNIGNLIYSQGINGTGTAISTGNIGIGSTTSGYKLAVAGSVFADSFIDNGITIAAPDYVFDDPEYEHLTIEEVETFVEDNDYLPWLTSRGPGAMSLTDRINEVLEALENLFLRVFELVDWNESQDVRMAAQAVQIEGLESENESLRDRLEQIEDELDLEVVVENGDDSESSNTNGGSGQTVPDEVASTTATTTPNVIEEPVETEAASTESVPPAPETEEEPEEGGEAEEEETPEISSEEESETEPEEVEEESEEEGTEVKETEEVNPDGTPE